MQTCHKHLKVQYWRINAIRLLSYDLGACILNAEGGEYVVANMSFHVGSIPIVEAEASSLLAVINLIIDLRLHNVVFEIDCKQVFDNLQSNKTMIFELGFILNACKQKLSLINKSYLDLFRTQVNQVAYAFVRATQIYVSL